MGFLAALMCARAAADFGVLTTHLCNATELLIAREALRRQEKPAPAAAYASMIRQAKALVSDISGTKDWSKEKGPWSVRNKTLAIPGVSPNNYISIGIYNHPCNNLPKGCTPYPAGHLLPPSECNNETGLPWEPCDGQRNALAIDMGDSPSQSRMLNAVKTLSYATFFCNETNTTCLSFAQRAGLILRTWFVNNETAMLPNLYYGQIMPAASPPSPGHGGFIEWAHMAELLDAVLLLQFAVQEQEQEHGNAKSDLQPSSSPAAPTPSRARAVGEGWATGAWTQAWSVADRRAFLRWTRSFLDYMGTHAAQLEQHMTNNHGSWFDVTWQSVALFADSSDEHGLGTNLSTPRASNTSIALKAALDAQRRIRVQILPNGTEWIELQRHEPSGYCEYNLIALSQDATLSPHSGVEIWWYETSDGRSLRKAIDWLLPYATGQEPWPHPQTEVPDWTRMNEVFRRAANAYHNATYEWATCETFARRNSSDYGKSVLNLLLPPRFDFVVESGKCTPKKQGDGSSSITIRPGCP